MTSGSVPSNPFVAGAMIEDPQLFVGRQDELRDIASRMSGVQPISINVVGKPRIGKSSLLYHFWQSWEQRLSNTNEYVVVYVSLQNAGCQTEKGFYQALADALLNRVSGWKHRGLRNPLQVKPFNREAFADAMMKWKQQNVLPVFCLDGFEALLKHQDEFDDGFYDNLRSLMDANALMLVISSRQGLGVYAKQHRFISRFFNLGHTMNLGELTTDDAIALTRLPNSTAPALTTEEQNYAQQWGNRHPYLLQLAGYWLWEARQQGKPVSWAKEQFERGAENVPKEAVNITRASGQVLLRLWKVPLYVGRVTTLVGRNLDDAVNRIIGVAILILVLLAIARVLSWNQVWDFVRDRLEIK